MPECLRLLALFGIVVVILRVMALSALEGMVAPAGETARDAVSVWLVNGRAVLKTCGLCAFMCGVGIGLLMRWAAWRGLPFGRIDRTPMIGLALLGIAHGRLFFSGYVLKICAVMGAILCLFRNWPVARPVRYGVLTPGRPVLRVCAGHCPRALAQLGPPRL